MEIGKKERMRRISKEIATITTSLPLNASSSILVRVDESRNDVLRAMITGPEGTPYENGCFVFDIFLPLAYPEQPPKVLLTTTGSGTVRFNPNLYMEGKVCLSLFGIWTGPGWDSKHSTLLQVLLSIQSLILVDNPYYNEPGFENHKHEAASQAYNSALRYQTMRVAMLEALRTPVSEFKVAIETHFRTKRERMRKQIEAWTSQNIPPGKAANQFGGFGGGALHQLSPVLDADVKKIAAELIAEIDGVPDAEMIVL
jgi:ubiquitin-protein ligase